MHNFLMAVTPFQKTEAFAQKVIAITKEHPDCWLFICYIINDRDTDRLGDSVLETGFVGEKLTHDLENVMEKEYSDRGREAIESIVELALDANIESTPLILRGNFIDLLAEKVVEMEINELFVIGGTGGRIKKFLGRTVAQQLSRCCDCKLTLISEQGEIDR